MDKPDFPVEGRGRSAKKRAAKEVEALAVRLVELRPSEVGKLPLSAQLAAELRLARSTEGHSSRKRQIKHLAGLLRSADEERAALLQGFPGDGGHAAVGIGIHRRCFGSQRSASVSTIPSSLHTACTGGEVFSEAHFSLSSSKLMGPIFSPPAV